MADYYDEGDHTRIVVNSHETFSKSVGATETWENVLIDISATGACYDIYAAQGSWTIRNIGVRGKIDADGAPDSGPFTSDGANPGETCLIENVYLPGATYGRNEVGTNNPYGFYLSPGHEGTLEIRNYHAKDMPSHGMYCSDPGHPDGGSGGVVEVYDSYVHDLENSGFRLGSTGSFIENCCAARTTRGLWAYFEDIEARNSELVDNDNDIQVGSGAYSKGATCTVENTAFDSVYELNGSLSGTSAGSPSEFTPEGVPTSAEEAATGGGSGGGGGGGGSDPPESTLERETFDHGDLSGNYSGTLGHFGIGSEGS